MCACTPRPPHPALSPRVFFGMPHFSETKELCMCFNTRTILCHTLRHTAARCNTLTRIATHCSTLQSHCSTLQHTATHCNALHHAAITLQHTATHCSTLQHTATHRLIGGSTKEETNVTSRALSPGWLSNSLCNMCVSCSVLQCAAVCRSVLQPCEYEYLKATRQHHIATLQYGE